MSTSRRLPILRRVRFSFQAQKPEGGEGSPKYWFGDSIVATHFANSMNLLFPEGERFLVRTLRAYGDRIDEPGLKAEIRSFIGQELLHGKHHTRFFEVLREQGVPADRFLALYEKLVFQMIEQRLPLNLRLSAGAALEHYTAIFSTAALSSGIVEELVADPAVRNLLLWHSAEEIEHKAVVFDALNAIDDSYALRMAGYAITTALLVAVWGVGAVALAASDRDLTVRRLLTQRGKPFSKRKMARIAYDFCRDFVAYAKPSFHPWQDDNYELARPYLETLEAA